LSAVSQAIQLLEGMHQLSAALALAQAALGLAHVQQDPPAAVRPLLCPLALLFASFPFSPYSSIALALMGMACPDDTALCAYSSAYRAQNLGVIQPPGIGCPYAWLFACCLVMLPVSVTFFPFLALLALPPPIPAHPSWLCGGRTA